MVPNKPEEKLRKIALRHSLGDEYLLKLGKNKLRNWQEKTPTFMNHVHFKGAQYISTHPPHFFPIFAYRQTKVDSSFGLLLKHTKRETPDFQIHRWLGFAFPHSKCFGVYLVMGQEEQRADVQRFKSIMTNRRSLTSFGFIPSWYCTVYLLSCGENTNQCNANLSRMKV